MTDDNKEITAQEASAAVETLKNVAAILDYAKARGYRLKRATAYKHQAEGRFRADSEGRYPVDKIDKYLATLRKIGGGIEEKSERQQAARAQATADKEAAQARYWQIRTKIMEGEYVEKNAFERALAQRAAIFKNDIESFCRAQAAAIINLAGGNADRAPDLIEFMLEKSAEWLNRYAVEQEFALPAATPAALLAKDEALRMQGEQKTEGEDEAIDES